MYKDAETSWAIESAPLRKKNRKRLSVKKSSSLLWACIYMKLMKKKNWKINCESCPPTRTLLYNNLYPYFFLINWSIFSFLK